MKKHVSKIIEESLWGSVYENGPPRLICLSPMSPASGIVWERLGGVTLLEEVCHKAQAIPT